MEREYLKFNDKDMKTSWIASELKLVDGVDIMKLNNQDTGHHEDYVLVVDGHVFNMYPEFFDGITLMVECIDRTKSLDDAWRIIESVIDPAIWDNDTDIRTEIIKFANDERWYRFYHKEEEYDD